MSDGSATGITYGLAGQDGQPWVQDYTDTQPVEDGSGKVYVLHDQQGDLLGYDDDGQVYIYVTDNLGSPVDTIDSDGTPRYLDGYEPYGYNSSIGPGSVGDNLFGFTGALEDPLGVYSAGGSGFVHLGQRWYDPVVEPSSSTTVSNDIGSGRFTQQDSVTQLDSPSTCNQYAYAADNPVSYTDPTGQGAACDYAVGGLWLAVSVLAGIALPGIGGVIVGAALGVFGLWDTVAVCGA